MDFISGREWQYAFILTSFLIMIAGFIKSRNLSSRGKKTLIRKFACAAIIPFTLLVLFEKPYVFFGSKTNYSFQEQKAENLNSVEDIARYEKEQTQDIKLLREEVESLRKDLREVNEYYGRIVLLLVTVVNSFCIVGIFKRDGLNTEEDLAEKPKILQI